LDDQFSSSTPVDGRKLYVVPLIFKGSGANDEYAQKHDLYWQQAKQHISNLEAKFGSINRIYHEFISVSGNEGLKVIERLSGSHIIVKDIAQRGAILESIEDKDLLDECMDWERCILMGLVSQKVAQVVVRSFADASRLRCEHIANRIDATLHSVESGILFIREGHSIQFPSSIQVFSVAPPALDQIHRFLRERESRE